MTDVFCAIDTPDLSRATSLAAQVVEAGGHIKLGLEFFIAHGPQGLRQLRASCGGGRLFLDLKLHDIPNTVAGAVRSAIDCGADFLTLHAAGGTAMMEAARQAAQQAGSAAPKLLGVTVLTHLDDAALAEIGQGDAPTQAARLAQLASDTGLDGAVCSPHEIAMLRARLPREFSLVVPGIRPAGAAADDQKRVMTPAEAAAAGADYLVIGRPITQATDPAAALRAILQELAA